QINIESEIVNLKMNKIYEYKNPIKIKKGEEIGCFHMGSTIVILSKNWEYDLKPREKVLFGQQIAKYKE
ncbi:MAG: phosphatidylserine decarboxylase, partial [Helicobacter sp.]